MEVLPGILPGSQARGSNLRRQGLRWQAQRDTAFPFTLTLGKNYFPNHPQISANSRKMPQSANIPHSLARRSFQAQAAALVCLSCAHVKTSATSATSVTSLSISNLRCNKSATEPQHP